MATYDKWGFDEEGFNREGFNKMGFDREGYNKDGFDIHGFNRQGLNQRTLRDSDGYDADGYDKSGFNRSGFDRDGYDREGFNNQGYDRSGFDCNGYDKEGFDKNGYDRNGYDRSGYDENGYNDAGFDRNGYDKAGFDKDGYDSQGFDREGYNRNGYDPDGYGRDGYNVKGFDKSGFNKEGFDKDGFDRNGFDKKGYDRYGYDRSGFNQQGFNRQGYDRDGFNKYGMDSEGYDRYGYDRWGFDRNERDCHGFDIFGYDIEGYNIFGFDREGFDREGIHRDGFAKSDFDENGFHIYTGFNLQGYDREGYNINGFNADGYDKDGYNIDGYDHEGFNRDGFNKNGYDRSGFNNKGFNPLGFDKDGYDINGFNKSGFDREGFNREGYDREGYDRYGYDRNGQKKKIGLNDLKPGMTVYHVRYGAGVIKRFDKEQNRRYIVLYFNFSKEEKVFAFPGAFTGEGFPEKYLYVEKPNQIKQREQSFSETENEKEKKHYSDMVRYLRGPYLEKELDIAKEEFEPRIVKYVDTDGFLTSKEIGPGFEAIKEKIILEVERLVDEPYFAHISYSKNPDLYIGKKGIDGRVTDWADKQAAYYYQYPVFVGNKSVGLKLVREIDFGSKGYLGYRDLFNALKKEGQKSISTVADKRLSLIIKSNQADKKIHDIIETIQQNQYEIITQGKDQSMLVLGCAGSGKTMVLMHRIRYIKYHNPELDMNKIIVVSPTDILGRESRELSGILEISNIRQMTMTALYKNIIDDLLTDYYKVPSLFNKVSVTNRVGDSVLAEESIFNESLKNISKILLLSSDESNTYRKKQKNKLTDTKNSLYKKYGSGREFQHLYGLYKKAKEEIKRYGRDDYYDVLDRCEATKEEIDKLSRDLNFAELIYEGAGLRDEKDGEKVGDESFFLRYTKELAASVDMDELYRYLKNHEVSCRSITRLIQILCAFLSTSLDHDISKNLLKRVRSELGGYTKQQMIRHISRLTKRKKALEQLPRKATIIRFLLANGLVNEIGSELNFITSVDQLISIGDDVLRFFDEVHWEKGEDNPFLDFDLYEENQEKTKRLIEFEEGKGKWGFLQDIVLEEINAEENGGFYLVDSSQLFAACYLLTQIAEVKNYDKLYLFIDEFQDFSDIEIRYLVDFLSGSTFNLFGDYQQCINPNGISSEQVFSSRKLFSNQYRVNENYRNAREITGYVNEKFGMSMIGIGLPGKVEETSEIREIPLEEGDRAAIIIEDSYSKQIKLSGYTVHYFVDEDEIFRDSYNVIPVSQVKGLEFEKVIVLTEGMTDHQKYVACTRAIKALQVVIA